MSALIWLIIFGAEKDVGRKVGRCFLHDLLSNRVVYTS
jgi:hypothetical protein